jgi:adenosine deaminase
VRLHFEPATFRELPKSELHQHLDGSMRPATAMELAASAGLHLSMDEAKDRMLAPARCGSHTQLLTYFDLPISLLQDEASLRRVARELVEDLAADGVRYAEIRWAPRLHLERGLGVGDVIGAVADGVAEGTAAVADGSRPTIGLIVTAMRSHPPAANILLARTAGAFGPPVVGFDLAGPEAEYPAPPHAAAFLAAAEAGLALTAHVGEVAGAERIRDALAFGVRRIAHGVTAIEDGELVARLREEDVTLDMCPTSNVQSGIVASIAEHPLARLHRAGVSVTLSTDELTVTGTRPSEEYARVGNELALAPSELRAIAVNGFRRAFTRGDAIDALAAEAARAWDDWAASIIS